MRDRLRKLISKSEILCNTCGDAGNSYCVEAIADHLLANGVIVPPCKVGDTLYEITDGGKITTFTVRSFYQIARWMEDEVFGVILFTTREEAEKALAERSENDI